MKYRKYSVDSEPDRGSNVIVWNKDGDKIHAYFSRAGEFRRKYDPGINRLVNDVEKWAYAILKNRQSNLFNEWLRLKALQNGDILAEQYRRNLRVAERNQLDREVASVKQQILDFYK
jgi:hypothetical protein